MLGVSGPGGWRPRTAGIRFVFSLSFLLLHKYHFSLVSGERARGHQNRTPLNGLGMGSGESIMNFFTVYIYVFFGPHEFLWTVILGVINVNKSDSKQGIYQYYLYHNCDERRVVFIVNPTKEAILHQYDEA